MPTTLTYTDLAENYNEISRICHETKDSVYITKNGQKESMKCFSKNILMLKASKRTYMKKLK